MQDWVWLHREVMLAVHDEQLAEHGGQHGVRDMALFDSALARPLQVAAYGEPSLAKLAAAYGEPSLAKLAAAYGYGIARNHPFLDGNKRTAFVAVELFLMLNGQRLAADDASCVLTMLDVAAGQITEEAFAQWIETHLAPLQNE